MKQYFIIDGQQYEVTYNEEGNCIGAVRLNDGKALSIEEIIEIDNNCKSIFAAYNGFYKVNTSGFGVTTATFFNPITKEIFSKVVWDIDNDGVKEANKELYLMPICDVAKKMYLRHLGQVQVGDEVEIFKGRKMVGEIKKVVRFREWSKSGTYGNVGRTYAIFSDGTSVNVENCRLV